MKTLRSMSAAAILLLSLTACTKDPIENLDGDETGLYITQRDETVDFSSYSTFRLADSVVVISNNELVERVRTDYDASLINAFATAMEARGYTRVNDGTGADLGITINRIYNDYTGIVDYTDYYGYYGGYWDPYYWGYPGYNYYFPSFYGIYTITDGGVTIDMLDLKNAAADNQIRQVWNGLIRGSGTFNINRTGIHVNALFEQSPYIAKP